jgi:hypothetical protein
MNTYVLNRKAKADGVWGWDCEFNEPVLIFPVVLALLGDNPMQSEFACHIGMRGKMFCRACWVKGADALAEPVFTGTERTNDLDQGESDVDSARSSDGNASRGEESEGPEGEPNQQSPMRTPPNGLPKKKGKFVESLSSMISRVMSFMKVCFTVLCYLIFLI